MIEAIKKHWKSIVLTVLVIITLVGICLSVYQGGYCVTSKFAGNVEAKLSSVSVKDTVVSYEDYMSLYSGVTSVVGNYITGTAAFLTLLLLAAQFYEIRESKRRYEEDKRQAKIESEKNEVDRIFKAISEKIKLIKIEQQTPPVVRNGVQAIKYFSGDLGAYLELILTYDSLDANMKSKVDAMSEVAGEMIIVLHTLNYLGSLSGQFERESTLYLMAMYTILFIEMIAYLKGGFERLFENSGGVLELPKKESVFLCDELVMLHKWLLDWLESYEKISTDNYEKKAKTSHAACDVRSGFRYLYKDGVIIE